MIIEPLTRATGERVAISVMRNGNAFGDKSDGLQDGNVSPAFCLAFGKEACKLACQNIGQNTAEPKMCAEENLSVAIETFGVSADRFALVIANADNVKFGDETVRDKEPKGEGTYTKVEDSNAFFFRPGYDRTADGEPLLAAGMRMADCGALVVRFSDDEGRLVHGMVHMSRTNMRGPDAYKDEHVLNGKKVFWAEYVLGSAIEHYGTDPSQVSVRLLASVDQGTFIHNYANEAKMEAAYPGWDKLGFMKRKDDKAEDFDCAIDFRGMIGWQLGQAVKTLGLEPNLLDLEGAINTGVLESGFASHYLAARRKLLVAEGRDLYLIGITNAEWQKNRIRYLGSEVGRRVYAGDSVTD